MGRKKDGVKVGWIGLGMGLFVWLLSRLIFEFEPTPYLVSIQSDIAGVGIAIALLSLLFLIFKKRFVG